LFTHFNVHREPDKTLSTEVTRNWSEISYGRFQFDRIQREAAALLEVTKEDLLEFWDKYFAAVSVILVFYYWPSYYSLIKSFFACVFACVFSTTSYYMPPFDNTRQNRTQLKAEGR
jgi:hypothetical protein